MMRFLIMLIIAVNCNLMIAQDIAVGKKFFTTEYMRLGMSLSIDASFANSDGDTGLIQLQNESIKKDHLGFNKYPNTTFSLGFDIYSPTSTLGFYTELGINRQRYSIDNNSNTQKRDSINNTNIEIPLYAKLRIGKVRGKGQLWLAFGGGYSITTKSETTSFQNNLTTSNIDSKEQFNSIPFLSSIIGYELIIPFKGSSGQEIYNRDNFRVLLYAKGNYDLKNRFDPNISFNNQTELEQIDNADLRFLRISFGLKILLRLSGVVDIINDATKIKK